MDRGLAHSFLVPADIILTEAAPVFAVFEGRGFWLPTAEDFDLFSCGEPTPYVTAAVPIFPEKHERMGRLQDGEVFLEEHFVLAVLYVQLRACPVGVYGRAFLDFRQMFSAAKKAGCPALPASCAGGRGF
jgi:hypothetical protein